MKRLIIPIFIFLLATTASANVVDESGANYENAFACAVGNTWGSVITFSTSTELIQVVFNENTVFNRAGLYWNNSGTANLIATTTISDHVAVFPASTTVDSTKTYYLVADMSGSTAGCYGDIGLSIPVIGEQTDFEDEVYISGQMGSTGTIYSGTRHDLGNLFNIDSITTYSYVAPATVSFLDIQPLSPDDFTIAYMVACIMGIMLVIFVKTFSHFIKI